MTLAGAKVDLVHRDELGRGPSIGWGDGRPLYIGSANLDHVYHFGLDSGREGSFKIGRGGAEWLVLLGGMPLVLAARRLTGVRWELLAGSDSHRRASGPPIGRGRRVGFLGGPELQHRVFATVFAWQAPPRCPSSWTRSGPWALPG